MTANWEAIDVEEDDIAETISRRDFEEGVAAMRGIGWGLVGSLFILAAAAFAVGAAVAVIAAIVSGASS